MWPEINRYGNSRPVPKTQQRWVVDCPVRAIEMGHRAGSDTRIPKSDTCRKEGSAEFPGFGNSAALFLGKNRRV